MKTSNLITRNNCNLFINTTKQFGYNLRAFVACEPKLDFIFEPYTFIKYHINKNNPQQGFVCLVNQNTELVIDGFQGSSNSFFTKTFRKSQTRYVAVSHHMHSPAQIIKAIELKIPTLILIREPRGAILSLTSRWPYISVNCSLKNYISFYTKIKPYSDFCVVSTFSQITQNTEGIVPRINAKFGTQFDVVDSTQVQRKEPSQRKRQKSEERNKIKLEKIQEFDLPINIHLKQQAQELYANFSNLAQNNF